MALGVVPQELVFDPFFTVREMLHPVGYFGLKNNDDWIDEILHHPDPPPRPTPTCACSRAA